MTVLLRKQGDSHQRVRIAYSIKLSLWQTANGKASPDS